MVGEAGVFDADDVIVIDGSNRAKNIGHAFVGFETVGDSVSDSVGDTGRAVSMGSSSLKHFRIPNISDSAHASILSLQTL